MRKALVISFLLLPARFVAQTPAHPSMGPNDYFDIGATNYIFANDGFARTWIDEGTNRFPNDKRLQALARLVPPPQNQPKSQPKPEPKQDNKEQKEKPEEQKQEQKPQEPEQASSSKDKSDKAEQDAAAYAAGQMTPEQAEQLLDSQKGEEHVLQLKPEKSADRTKPIKDW